MIFLQSSIQLLSAMCAHTSVLLLITLGASMQDALGLPMMKQPEADAGDGAPTQRVRTKRCACSSPLDSECHYFCHLDIIWVNTPSKTTVYGLGGALNRRRRSLGRCTCAKPGDGSCTTFCHHSFGALSPKIHQLNIHSILRALSTRSKSTGFRQRQIPGGAEREPSVARARGREQRASEQITLSRGTNAERRG